MATVKSDGWSDPASLSSIESVTRELQNQTILCLTVFPVGYSMDYLCWQIQFLHIKTTGQEDSRKRRNWHISKREKKSKYLFQEFHKPNISFCQKCNIVQFGITYQLSDICPLQSALWRIMWLASAYSHILYTTRQTMEEMAITLFSFPLSKIAK